MLYFYQLNIHVVTVQWHVLLYQLNIHVCHSIVACFTLSLEYSCITVQWHVLLLSVEYSRSPQYSGLFYFYQLNIHVCRNTVACFTFIS